MTRRTSIKLIAGLVMLSAIATATATIAWFVPMATIGKEKNPIEGVTNGAYFAYGNGKPTTQENPDDRVYGITVPRHLYNLAWLQYLGFFNKDSGEQYYFELGNNIDMTGWTLPPIGTEDNPFIGNFNGNGYVVSNLTISNKFTDYEYHPSDVKSDNFVQPHILGFIGVLGDYNDEFGSTAYNSTANTFTNTGLTGLSINTFTKDTLMGIAVGYAETTMSNIAVDASTISIDTTISGDTTSYGGFTSNISDYSLVGYTEHTKTVTKIDETIYSVNLTNGHEFNATEQGEGATGWGGSIDMMSVTKRLQTIRSTGTASTNWAYKRTYEYHDGVKNTTYTTDASGTGSRTWIINNNDEIGHFNFIHDNDGTDDRYALLGGGHWETDKYYNKTTHTGRKITDGTNYLCINSITTGSSSNNAGSIKNQVGDSENDATVWTVPTGSSGYISTSYYYDKDGSPVTYYLYAASTTNIRLSTNTNYRTTWTRETDADGKIRYSTVYNNVTYYLGFNGTSWRLMSYPDPIMDEPTDPEDLKPSVPVEPEEPDYLNVNDYSTSTYQISYTNNGTTYYLHAGTGGTYSTSTTPYTNGWTFQYRTSNNSSWTTGLPSGDSWINTRVMTTIGGTTYYLSLSYSNYNGASMSLTTTSTYVNGRTGTNGYRFRSTNNTGTRSYLSFNTSNNAFTYGTSASYFQLPTSRVAAQNYNSVLEEEYDDLYQDYEDALASYDDDMLNYENYRDNIYPGLVEDYEADIERYETEVAATYTINQTSNTTMKGPDENLTDTQSGMNYDYDDVTYFPLSTINNTNDFRPADNNTAYVTGSSAIKSTTTSYNDLLTNVRFGYYPISENISDDFTVSSGTFSHVYTVNNSLQREEITNDSSYEKLTDAKKNLGAVLKEDGTNAYGLHFMDAAISMDYLMTAPYVKINKKTYTDYQLPVNSIDFHLKEFGYINFLAGTYYTRSSSDRNNSFFALYQIERLDSNPKKINRILEVLNVYKHTSNANNYSYVYQLQDTVTGNTFYTKPYKVIDADGNKEWLYDTESSYSNNQYVNSLPSNYSLVFNCSRIKKNSINSSNFDYHVFYFEIPMNDGEFCLGSVSGAVGAYLMYLDIGANASKYQRTIFYEHFDITTNTYKHPEGVALSSIPEEIAKNTVYIPDDLDDADSACVAVPAKYKNSLTIDRNEDDVALSRASGSNAPPPVYAKDSIKVHDKNSDTALDISTVTSETKNVIRMTYYDLNVNLDTVMTPTITDESTDGGTNYTRTSIVQKIYSTKNATGTPTSTYIYDPNASPAVDQRSSMKVYNTSNGVRYSDANLINRTTLAIDMSKILSTPILTVRILQPNGSFTETIDLIAKINQAITTGTYYLKDQYTITITPTGGAVTITVKSLATGEVIYYGTTQVTGADQVITVNP